MTKSKNNKYRSESALLSIHPIDIDLQKRYFHSIKNMTVFKYKSTDGNWDDFFLKVNHDLAIAYNVTNLIALQRGEDIHELNTDNINGDIYGLDDNEKLEINALNAVLINDKKDAYTVFCKYLENNFISKSGEEITIESNFYTNGLHTTFDIPPVNSSIPTPLPRRKRTKTGFRPDIVNEITKLNYKIDSGEIKQKRSNKRKTGELDPKVVLKEINRNKEIYKIRDVIFNKREKINPKSYWQKVLGPSIKSVKEEKAFPDNKMIFNQSHADIINYFNDSPVVKFRFFDQKNNKYIFLDGNDAVERLNAGLNNIDDKKVMEYETMNQIDKLSSVIRFNNQLRQDLFGTFADDKYLNSDTAFGYLSKNGQREIASFLSKYMESHIQSDYVEKEILFEKYDVIKNRVINNISANNNGFLVKQVNIVKNIATEVGNKIKNTGKKIWGWFSGKK
ncbi:MAG: hypothetical protein WC570_02785 [Patescibacteria group bacterium]